MAAFCTPANVRDYLNVQSTTGQYSDANLNRYIEVASNRLQRDTGRQFENQALVTKTIPTDGSPLVAIPDARVITAIRDADDVVVDTDDYDTVYDSRDGTVITAVRLGRWAHYSGHQTIEVDGSFGYTTLPAELVFATIVLAAWYAKRPDAVFGSTIQTESGNVIDVSRLPYEVWAFIKSWSIGPVLVA